LSVLETKTLKIVNICFVYIQSKWARKTHANGKITYWKLHRSEKIKLVLSLVMGEYHCLGKGYPGAVARIREALIPKA
jgi:hypothetical protein